MAIVPIKNQPVEFKANGTESCYAIPYLGIDKLSFQFNLDYTGANCGDTELIENTTFDRGTTLVNDGTFSNGANWTYTANWSVFSGQALYGGDGTTGQYIKQTITGYGIFQYYMVVIVVTHNTCGLIISIGGNNHTIAAGDTGTFTFYYALSNLAGNELKIEPEDSANGLAATISSIEMYNVEWFCSNSFQQGVFVLDAGLEVNTALSSKYILQELIGITVGDQYIVEIETVDNTSGTFDIDLGGTVTATDISGDGIQSFVITAGADDYVKLLFSKDYVGTIVSVSVKALMTSYLVDIFTTDDVFIDSIDPADITQDGQNVAVTINLNDYILTDQCVKFALVDQCSTNEDISGGRPVNFPYGDYTYISNPIKIQSEICEPNVMVKYRHDTDAFGFNYSDNCFYFYQRLIGEINFPSFDDTGSQQFNYSNGKMETPFFITKIKEQLNVGLYEAYTWRALSLLRGHRIVFIDDVLYTFEIGDITISWVKETRPLKGVGSLSIVEKTQDLTSKICDVAPPSCEADEALLIDPQNDYVIDPTTGRYILSNG